MAFGPGEFQRWDYLQVSSAFYLHVNSSRRLGVERMPSSITPAVKALASRLMALEAAAAKRTGVHSSSAFRVCERLREPLSRLAGIAGFRSLLSRALALASVEVRWLKAIHVNGNGSLEGLDEAQAQQSPDQNALGEIVLVAHLLGLLVTFIGQGLMLRLVEEAWPHATFNDLDD